MFDSNEEKAVDKHDINEPSLKKRKLDKLYESTLIHSSLEYKTIRAPPLVAYKSIDSYCENNYGQSYKTPSTSDLRDLQSISSPILLKTPKKQSFKKVLHEEAMPYTLFTVEELSLVKCLKNWFNVKVSAVGNVSHDTTTQKCYLNSVRECGQWSLLLDTSLLEEIPKLEQLLQVYGTLTMNGEEPCVKLCFIRRLPWVNLSLYHDSYRLMQKHIGKIECSKSGTEVQIVAKNSQQAENVQMNDTLDDCSFLM